MIKVQNSIREQLADRQLSMIDLSELTGISYATVQRIARSGSDPTIDQALLVGNALGATVEELFWLYRKCPKATNPSPAIGGS